MLSQFGLEPGMLQVATMPITLARIRVIDNMNTGRCLTKAKKILADQ